MIYLWDIVPALIGLSPIALVVISYRRQCGKPNYPYIRAMEYEIWGETFEIGPETY